MFTQLNLIIDKLDQLITKTDILRFSDFDTEVSKGNIEGHESFFLPIVNPTVGGVFTTVWDIATTYNEPVAGEQWEFFSDSPDDAVAGLGAEAIVVIGLDSSYQYRVISYPMDGINVTNTAQTDWLFCYNISTIGNIGKITLRQSGGGAGTERATVLPTNGRSFNGLYVTPAGKTAFIRQVQGWTPKGQDNQLLPLIKAFGAKAFSSGGSVDTFQNQNGVDYTSRPRFPEKTTLEWQAKTGSPTQRGSAIMEILEVENQYLDLQQSQQFQIAGL